MSDRTGNPQSPGVRARDRSLLGAGLALGVRRASPIRFTFFLLPVPLGTVGAGRFGYRVTANLRRAAAAGPPGYSARLRAVNRVGGA